jgi:N-acetylneuraminate synthase
MARFIAELGSNHNRDLDRALALVDACADVGADAVKVQVFRIEDLFAPEALAAHPELAARRARELPLELLAPLAARCRARGLRFGATPFALWAVAAVAEHVDFLKVASYELLWHDLLRACVATGRPLVLSTGMATGREVDAAFAAIGDARLTILHCVSAYPAPAEQCNLAAIAALRERHGVAVGWSDHSGDPAVVQRAVRRWGASDVELHVDAPDRAGLEPGAHNWTPAALATVIARCRADPAGGAGGGDAWFEAPAPADGDGVKRPAPAEAPDVPWRADPADGLRPLRAAR